MSVQLALFDVPPADVSKPGAWLRSEAKFSSCRAYRYLLIREWNPEADKVCWLMLNPSTADEATNDRTVRRCEGFSRDWGFGGFEVVNLFAFRSPYPAVLKKAAEPIGPENDAEIEASVRRCALIVGAWGNHGAWRKRGEIVTERFLRGRSEIVFRLGSNENGTPVHPLFQEGRQTLKPFFG